MYKGDDNDDDVEDNDADNDEEEEEVVVKYTGYPWVQGTHPRPGDGQLQGEFESSVMWFFVSE